jgi:hypothetical protein
VQLRAEEVDPEIPVYGDPQETFADTDERGCDNPPRKIPYYLLRPIHFGH